MKQIFNKLKQINETLLALVILISVVGVFIFYKNNKEDIASQSNTPTQISDKKQNTITEECKRIVDYLWEDSKFVVHNNQTALEIIKKECLQLIPTSTTADFDGDNQDEIVMITSGAGCVSCHGQEIRIIKGNKVIFYKDGLDFIIKPVKDFAGFILQYPVEDLSTPEAGYVIESYKMKRGGSGLETFYKFNEEKKSYVIKTEQSQKPTRLENRSAFLAKAVPIYSSTPTITEKPECDNYKDVQKFEKPVPMIWTAKLDGCLVGCLGASFTKVPEDKKYPRFAGYYFDDKSIPDKFLQNGLILKIYGEWIGIDYDHSRTVFENKCVPIVDIEKIEVIK